MKILKREEEDMEMKKIKIEKLEKRKEESLNVGNP